MKKIKIMIGFLIVFIAMMIYPFKKIAMMPQESLFGNGEFVATGEVDTNHTLEQRFISQGDYLKCISVYIQNSANGNEARVVLEIVDENESIICKKEYGAQNIPSYEWKDLTVNAELEKNKLYKIRISLKNAQDEHIQLFSIASEAGSNGNQEYFYDGRRQNGTISFVYKYMNYVEHMRDAVPFWVILFVLYVAITTVMEHVMKRDDND